MPDADCYKDIGSLKAEVEELKGHIARQQAEIDSFKADKNRLIGIGSAMSIIMVAIGYVFGDWIKTWVNRAMQ